MRVRYRLCDEAWESLLQRLADLRYRAAIVGREGAGKTTLLEDLEPHLTARGYEVVWLRLTQEQPAFASDVIQSLRRQLNPRHIILFDGAEQLSRWSWWRFTSVAQQAGGLIITSHRHGLLPTVLECRTDAGLLASIVSELLGEPAERLQATADELFLKYHGNLRDALRDLYDRWAERSTDPEEYPLLDADRSLDKTEACPHAG